MNKELIEMIDKPETGRGKILAAMAGLGFMKAYDIAELAGLPYKTCNAQLMDIAHDSGYIDIERKKINDVFHFKLVGMKCKMSEARTVKAARYQKEETTDIPYDKWRKVFGLMDGCHG